MTVVALADLIQQEAHKEQARQPGLKAPSLRNVQSAVAGDYRPRIETMLLIRSVTGGEVDLEHWAADELPAR